MKEERNIIFIAFLLCANNRCLRNLPKVCPALTELHVMTEKVMGFTSACVMNPPLGKYSAHVPAQMGRCSHTVMHCSAACNSEGALMTPGFGAENASHLALPPSLEADFLPVKGGCLKD